MRVKAPPIDGAANEELIRFLARRLNVSRSAVQLLTGAGSRRKRVRVEGLHAEELAQRLLPPHKG
jgi:uncharacterized protein YggU (UPF0235/DUF167 family)